MAKQWYVKLRGNVDGPLSSSALKRDIAAGVISSDTWIKLGSTGKWTPAGFVKGLFEPLPSMNPPSSSNGNKGKQGPNGQGEKTEPRSLALESIFNNPFRVLGVPVTAKSKEIERAFSKVKAFASVGKVYTSNHDLPLGLPPNRSPESVQGAKAKLEQDQHRIQSSLFWFWEGNSVDEMAFEAIRRRDSEKAVSLWERVTRGSVSKSNFSCVRNLSLYLLIGAEAGGKIDTDQLQQSLHLSADFLSSDFLRNYAHAVLSDDRTRIKVEDLSDYFANTVLGGLENALQKKRITPKTFVHCFEGFPGNIPPKVIQKYSAESFREIEQVLDGTKKRLKDHPDQGLKAGKDLLKVTKRNLRRLEDLLDEDDYLLEDMRSRVGSQLDNCCIAYFNWATDNTESYPGEECLALAKAAYKVCGCGRGGSRLQESIKHLEEHAKAEPVIDFIIKKLEGANELSRGLYGADRLIEDCKPKLLKLEGIVGAGHELVSNFSDAVAGKALGQCIAHCNDSIGDHNELLKAVSTMESIGKLKMTPRCRVIYKENRDTLVHNLKLAQKNDGCYVATMVYGSTGASEVIALRRFRDRMLSHSFLGRTFIKIYYRHSPGFVRRVQHLTWLHRLIKFLLDPLVKHIR